MDETRYGIRTRTWGRKAAGLHYYGNAWRRLPNGDSDDIELRFTLDADTASALNKKDNASWSEMAALCYKRGDSCHRYSNLTRLLRDGIATIEREWGHTGRIEHGPAYAMDSPLARNDDGSTPTLDGADDRNKGRS